MDRTEEDGFENLRMTIADGVLTIDAADASTDEIIRFIEYMEDRKLTYQEKRWLSGEEE